VFVIAAAVLALAALAWHTRRRYVGVTVVGHSMMPTLHHGQKLLARRWRASRAPLQRSQIIVFIPPVMPGQPFESDLAYRIKRVVAIAGDPAPSWLPALPGDAPLVRVPPAMVVVLGDNPRSEDSRRYGCVPEASVIAMIRADRRSVPS